MGRHKSDTCISDIYISDDNRENTPGKSILHFSAKRSFFFAKGPKTTSGKEFQRPAVNAVTSMLTEIQMKTLRAMVDCIIPADDYPSGWDAGVGSYLSRLLTREPQFLFIYQTGLDGMEAEASGFHLWDSAAQNARLAWLEQDAAQGAFFRLLVTHVMEGFYADPGNGGNTNEVSWQMIGFRVTA